MHLLKKYVGSIIIVLLILEISNGKKKETDVAEFISKAVKTIGKSATCGVQQLTKKYMQSLWLKDKGSDETLLCTLNFLEANTEDGFSWCLLGSSFEAKHQKQQADFCFKQSAKLMGKYSQFIKEWHYIGPFVIGKTEIDGHPLSAYGGIKTVAKFRLDYKPAPNFASELVPDGLIKWRVVKQTQEKEMVQVKPVVDWNDLVSSLGSLGITEWQGWAVGELFINEDNLQLSFQCHGVARCIIGNSTIVGDLYHRSQFWFPVSLTRGVHSIYIPLRSKVSANFKFSISKLTLFKVLDPPFQPDIYNGYLPTNFFVPIPISNLMVKKWLKINKITIADQSDGDALLPVLLNTSYEIAPGQTRSIIVQLKSHRKTQFIAACKDIDLQLKIKTSEGAQMIKLTLRCRKLGESFLLTFLDHDGSVQHAAAIEPLGSCPDKICPVLLTLHGTTVPPQNQADSYKQMVKGNFQFGVKKMWLLAPTRHGAHNWEGPGALTAITALKALHQMTLECDWLETVADPTKVLYAGHSMGGHGAWHLASHFPDRAIGLISLASWIKKEEYGDSNLFFRHDIATSHTDASTKAVMEACIGENDADKHITNLKGVSVLARIGGNDRTVHPFYVRRMVRLLKEAKVDVTYSELQGLEHWWWDTKDTNDGGCVNDAQIRKFIAQISNSLPLNQQQSCFAESGDCEKTTENRYANQEQHSVTLVTVNPAFGEGLKGVRVLQQLVPFRTSKIQISASEDTLRLLTENVKCLQIRNDTPNRAIDYSQIKTFYIDGNPVSLQNKNFHLRFCLSTSKTDSSWQQVPDSSHDSQSLVRGPDNYGPARRVAEREFIIVIGTQANQSTSDILLRHGVYIANQFFLTSDTIAPVVEDKNVKIDDIEHLNLILIGGPRENLLASHFLDLLPDLELVIGKDTTYTGLKLGDLCTYEDPRTGILTLTPHGQKGLALILMGLSFNGLEDIVSLSTPTIPPMARSPFSNLLPDFVITGPDFDLKGPGGFRCAGFWNNNWKFDTSSASCTCGAS